MLILLPPSETKRSGGSGSLRASSLRGVSTLSGRDGATAAELSRARSRVRSALVALSRDAEAAVKPLKLGVKNRDELAHNLRLDRSGVMPAIERYTGVLYDALEVAALDGLARAWIDDHVLVQSALFGLISAADEIPAYRLSAGSRLPELGAPLKRVWIEAHRSLEWPRDRFVLDLRSQDYGALAPLPEGVGSFLNVVQRGADGEVRALNHFNKAAKGDLVRRLATSRPELRTVVELCEWGAGQGLELIPSGSGTEVTLVTRLGAPGTARS